MKSFHGSETFKRLLIAKTREHRLADTLVRGKYWDGAAAARADARQRQADKLVGAVR